MSIFNSLVRELRACRIVDLASDLGDAPAGPFETRIDSASRCGLPVVLCPLTQMLAQPAAAVVLAAA